VQQSPAPQITSAAVQQSPSNAFIPQSPSVDLSSTSSTNNVVVAPSNPNNLTDQLADAFVNGVASANPSGPANDGTGNLNLAQPDVNSIALFVANASATQKLQVPNWDYEANSQPIKIKASSASADITQYASALNDIFTKHFVATNLTNIVSDSNPDPSQVGVVETQIQAALGDLLALQVPTPLVGLQKGLVKIFVYEKNELQLTQNASTDPLKTALILQGEQDKFTAALTNLQTQIDQAAQVGLSFNKNIKEASSPFAFLNVILGIHEAHALFGVGDIVFDPGVFGRLILTYINDISLQILKNTLIALIQRHVLSWVQGSGAPRFIQNWGLTLINSYEQTALSVLNSKFACISPSILPQLRATLGTFYRPATNNFCANTFQAALGGNTLQQFSNNFSRGGWLAFGTASLPTNNYYGGLYFSAQIIGANAQNGQQAALAEANSSQGFIGDKVCADGSTPTGSHVVCETPGGDQIPSNNGSCPAGTTKTTIQNGGFCANGSQPITTTPGAVVGLTVNSAIDSSPKLIAAANSIVGLLGSLTTSLLNSLATEAVNAGTQGILGIGSQSIQGGGTPPPPLPLACNPQSETVSITTPASIAATGGKADVNGNEPTYTWRSSDGTVQSGFIFSETFPIAGSYAVQLSDNTGDAPVTCNVTVQ
jgi:hypothetical protein